MSIASQPFRTLAMRVANSYISIITIYTSIYDIMTHSQILYGTSFIYIWKKHRIDLCNGSDEHCIVSMIDAQLKRTARTTSRLYSVLIAPQLSFACTVYRIRVHVEDT